MRISDGSSAVCSSDLYSRSQETQADDLAVQYLSRAGYDPAAMASALRSLAAQNSLDQQIAGARAGSVPEWVSTHPDPQSRVQRAASQAASTNRPYRPEERRVGKE